MQRLSVVKNSEVGGWLTGVNSLENTNWVKVQSKSYNNVTLNELISCSDNDKFKFVVRGHSVGFVFVRPNSDSTYTNYRQARHYSGQNTSNNPFHYADVLYHSSYAGFLVCDASSHVFAESVIDIEPANSGLYTSAHIKLGHHTASNNTTINNHFGSWLNTTSKVESLQLVSSGNFTGTITIYKWQDVKLSSLASYELVKEYVLANQALNDTILVDTSVSDTYLITSAGSSIDYINVYMNGDTGNNYWYTSTSSGYARAGMFLDNYMNAPTFGKYEMRLNLKTGNVNSITDGGAYTVKNVNQAYQLWTNTTTPVTSISLATGANLMTGTVRVYRLATKQLLKQNINPVELVLNKDYVNAAVSESIDVSDCDELEISLLGSSSTDNCWLRFNNDATITNYKLTYHIVNGTSNSSNSGNGTNNNVINGTNQNGSVSVARINVYHTVKKFDCMMTYDSATYPLLQRHAQQWNGAAKVTSVQIICPAGFSGKIKVWKKY